MKITKRLFENIITLGKSDSKTTIFDDIEDEAEKIEHKDLYDAFDIIIKVSDNSAKYNEIQTVSPAIDVNRGQIKISGFCKHRVAGSNIDVSMVEPSVDCKTIIDEYVKELEERLPEGLKLESKVFDSQDASLDKVQFEIVISRKGKK